MSKKIMFNDKHGLTQAVLDGRKTMTRRIVSEKLLDRWTDYDDFCNSVSVENIHTERQYYDEKDFFLNNAPYKLGEVVAIAQSYKNIDNYYNAALYRKTSIHGQMVDELDLVSFQDIRRWKYFSGDLMNTSGWTNKMFAKADLMPHHIEITDIKVERLQDISDEDCLKEGIYEDSGDDEFPPSIFYEFEGNKDDGFDTPREAFTSLIDKVSGKGTWERNPFVWVYEFKLLD